mgnify:CR=1 FL=1
MSDFDYDKIKNMEYDSDRKRYIGKDGSEFRVTPYKDGTGYKYDYYGSSTYKNAKHDGTHVTSDLNENWNRTDNDRSNGTQTKSSGTGCYLTTACMKHYLNNFDDNCYELTVLRWFRDNFVSKDDIKHYYSVAPSIVEAIEKEGKMDIIYDYIYDNIVDYCVNQIENGNYENAYLRYRESILDLECAYSKTKVKKLIKA